MSIHSKVNILFIFCDIAIEFIVVTLSYYQIIINFQIV